MANEQVVEPNRCSGCRFWRSNDGMRGYCFLRPPVVLLMPIPVDSKGNIGRQSRLATPDNEQAALLPSSVRPLTLASDFCRQWEMPYQKVQ